MTVCSITSDMYPLGNDDNWEDAAKLWMCLTVSSNLTHWPLSDIICSFGDRFCHNILRNFVNYLLDLMISYVQIACI